jgi:mono/diheme cytochrome c family protein
MDVPQCIAERWVRAMAIVSAQCEQHHPCLNARSVCVGATHVRRTRGALAVALLLSISMLTKASAAHASGMYYTSGQADNGRIVFNRQCAICHGNDLLGKSGPALAGQQFLSVSQYQNLTADYLYRFMSKHMPLNAPGSLSKTQYLDTLAYILQVNGYTSGRQALTADDRKLTQIKIEPTGTSQQSSR